MIKNVHSSEYNLQILHVISHLHVKDKLSTVLNVLTTVLAFLMDGHFQLLLSSNLHPPSDLSHCRHKGPPIALTVPLQ